MYVKHWESLERQVLAERQVVATLVAATGSREVKLPSLEQVRSDYDDGLCKPLLVRRINRRQIVLRRALGVA